ncbi:MAG TPA: polymer-forming cytoskeletal protein [Terriglobales bacterium]|nr:polymer-forming cytoskeletal protein [Terriglobales bacterium]
MWKRKEDDYANVPETNIAGSSYAPTAPAPPRPPEPVRNESMRSSEVATIGKSVVVKGELSGSEDLIVDGEVEGSISLRGQSLTVGPNGRVRANIEARNVIVHGRVDGDIHATDRVDLRKSASLSGDIATARISIEDGAFFKGGIDIQRPESGQKVETKPQASAAAAPAAGPASAAAPPVSVQGSLLESKKM